MSNGNKGQKAASQALPASPELVWLPALGKSLLINYLSNSDVQGAAGWSNLQPVNKHARKPQPTCDLQLDVTAYREDLSKVVQEIVIHLKSLARDFLTPLLASYAHLHGLHYKRVSIRGQRTRWGSYSSTGTLTLNYKLLFLSRELVDYVVLHELAHTRHLDHSKAFWQFLSQLDVNARMLDRQLRKAGSVVPLWLEVSR